MEIAVQSILEFINAEKLKYKVLGLLPTSIRGFCSIKRQTPHSLTWIRSLDKVDISCISSKTPLLIITDWSKEILPEKNHAFIMCDNPKELFFLLLKEFFSEKIESSISKNSIVETACIGRNVSIGHNCYIGKNVVIGDNVIIKNSVNIECVCRIGNRTIINSGSILGTDGFGYFKRANGKIERVQHFGGISIGENVEIGSNVCIDRGTIDDTYIGDNVKIDNLCHIAHNAIIMDNSIIIALSMVGGSTVLNKSSYVAPGCIIRDQIVIGENGLIGMGSVVTKNVNPNKVVLGVPAKEIRDNNEDLLR